MSVVGTLGELLSDVAAQFAGAAVALLHAHKDRDAHAATIAKTRAALDAALGTTKGATTFALEDIAEELALQHKGFKKERDALKGRDPCETCRNDRRKAIEERDAVIASGDRVELRHALGAEKGETPLDAAKRVVRELADAINNRNLAYSIRDGHMREVSACCEREMTVRKMWSAEQDEHAAVIRERDAHAAAIETLSRTIEEAKTTPIVTAKPQPGDVVPWAEVEADSLYFRPGYPCPFRMVIALRQGVMAGTDDCDLAPMINGEYGGGDLSDIDDDGPGILIARDLGSDPEAWRAAMCEWTANGNRPKATAATPAAEWCNENGPVITPAAKPEAPRPFKVGDKVRIARKVETDSKGRESHWVDLMDGNLGDDGTVENDYDELMIGRICVDGWFYSPEALDLVTPAPA